MFPLCVLADGQVLCCGTFRRSYYLWLTHSLDSSLTFTRRGSSAQLDRYRSCDSSSSSRRSARNILIKDWYGTSLLFARSLISASMSSGRRSEIVFSDGFKFGNITRLALDQSTYWVESSLAQNSRSWSSDLNFGTFFFFTTRQTPFVLFDSCPVQI